MGEKEEKNRLDKKRDGKKDKNSICIKLRETNTQSGQ